MPQQRRKRRRPQIDTRNKKKVDCSLCKDGNRVDYKDITMLRKYVSERGKIRSSRVTRLCGVCQRQVAIAVKNAREMALLPYISPRSSKS
ncbi:MAG: 30S ribosomal protein S18 [Acidimicrobiia bacterium]|nr:30S ribosomal protein S18 [Acidimicrobiia bacterium]